MYTSYLNLVFIFIQFLFARELFAQITFDDSTSFADYNKPTDSCYFYSFEKINPDTISIGEFDELIFDSYCAKGKKYVYDALHSFNRRRMDHFGGRINEKINNGLKRIRDKGYKSDVKQLYIQMNAKELTVYWFAVVGPSNDGFSYNNFDSRGSARGSEYYVNKQLPAMHRLYPGMKPVRILDLNEIIPRFYDSNGKFNEDPTGSVGIRQFFFKYRELTEEEKRTLPKSPSYRKHRVKSGETLSGLAVKYHTTVKSIKRLNGLKSDMIYIDQYLKIPL